VKSTAETWKSGGYGALVLLMLLVAALGASVVRWHASTMDRWMREDLIHQVELVARTIDPDVIASLSGSESDLAAPQYQRLKQQLIRTRALFPQCRFLYLTGLRPDGGVFFFVDSESSDSGDYSPPGQMYEEASPEFRGAHIHGKRGTEGPIEDRWGVWVTGFAPLTDPRTGRIRAVVGIDRDAAGWKAALAVRTLRYMALIFFCELLLAGIGLARWRASAPPHPARWLLRNHDVVVTIAIGFTVTWGGMEITRERDQRSEWESFRVACEAELGNVMRTLSDIRDYQLEGLARFFEGSQFVDREEFREYNSFLARYRSVRAWAWAPVLAKDNLASFEEGLRREGLPDYRVWPPDAKGDPPEGTARRAMYYPICHVEPVRNNETLFGLDLGAIPETRSAMATALGVGLVTASDPVELAGSPENIVVVRPVKERGNPGHYGGFVLVVLDMQRVLERVMSPTSTRLSVQVRQIEPGGASRRLAAMPRTTGEISFLPSSADRLHMAAPILVFGKTYAILCQPGPLFRSLHMNAWRAGLAGAVMTAMLAALVGILRGRERSLEQLVRERTEALRGSEGSYRDLFNSVKLAIFIQDREARFVDVNKGALTMSGYAREDLIGKTPEFLSAPGRDQAANVAMAMAEVWAGKPQYLEYWCRDKNGRVFPVEVWLSLGQYAGKPAVIAVVSETTERRQAQAERERLSAQVLQLQKMESIGRLAGGVAHDFNNMLQVILGNVTVALAESGRNEPVREHLEEIERSANRSAELTRQLLAFASRQPVRPRVLDLNDTLSGMLKMLRRLIGEDIQLLWSPGADLWPVEIDPSQLDQILANLAVNAHDAIDSGGRITIETANATLDERGAQGFLSGPPGDYVMLSVSDNGRGMSPEAQAHMFEPFFTTKPVTKGTGLGLATVFGIVKQNGGVIQARTAPGEGTTFRIFLPRSAVAAKEGFVASSAPAPSRGRGETILLVEDEPSILRFGRQSLEQLGYRVKAAGSPAEALDLARQHDGGIDLLLTDVVLPEMNGKMLAEKIRALHPRVRCLFMSGYTADAIERRGLLDDAVFFVQKPFGVGLLSAKVREALDARLA
jgi:PAS domain S-box-containing protein